MENSWMLEKCQRKMKYNFVNETTMANHVHAIRNGMQARQRQLVGDSQRCEWKIIINSRVCSKSARAIRTWNCWDARRQRLGFVLTLCVLSALPIWHEHNNKRDKFNFQNEKENEKKATKQKYCEKCCTKNWRKTSKQKPVVVIVWCRVVCSFSSPSFYRGSSPPPSSLLDSLCVFR